MPKESGCGAQIPVGPLNVADSEPGTATKTRRQAKVTGRKTGNVEGNMALGLCLSGK